MENYRLPPYLVFLLIGIIISVTKISLDSIEQESVNDKELQNIYAEYALYTLKHDEPSKEIEKLQGIRYKYALAGSRDGLVVHALLLASQLLDYHLMTRTDMLNVYDTVTESLIQFKRYSKTKAEKTRSNYSFLLKTCSRILLNVAPKLKNKGNKGGDLKELFMNVYLQMKEQIQNSTLEDIKGVVVFAQLSIKYFNTYKYLRR